MPELELTLPLDLFCAQTWAQMKGKINDKTTINVFGFCKGRKLWGQKVASEINANILPKNLKNFKLQNLQHSTQNYEKLQTRYFIFKRCDIKSVFQKG